MTDRLAPGSRISRDPTLSVYRGAGARATCIASEEQKCRVTVLEMKSYTNQSILLIFFILHNYSQENIVYSFQTFPGKFYRLTSRARHSGAKR